MIKFCFNVETPYGSSITLMYRLDPFQLSLKCALVILLTIPCPLLATDKIHKSLEALIFDAEPIAIDEIKGTIYSQNFTHEKLLQNSTLGLLELKTHTENSDFEIGIAFDNIDNEPSINQLSYTEYFDDYEIKIGKFVSKIGVLDFFSSIDIFNTTRIQYYDEESISLRKKASLLGQVNYFIDENNTINLIVAPFDNSRRDFFDRSIGLSLNSVIPFYLVNSGNETIDLIAEPVLLPSYNNGAKQATNNYINSKLPKENLALNTTTFAVNYLSFHNQATFGAVYVNGYSNLPFINIDEQLIAAVENLNRVDQEEYINAYLQKEDNQPIKSIEYFRYNLVAAYIETTWNSLGLRAEISYRDKFPIINSLTEQISVGLGVDHKDKVYNNLEIQYFYIPEQSIRSYYAIWQLRFDTFRVGEWEAYFEQTSTYAAYEKEEVFGFVPSLKFRANNLDISLEYLLHSKQEWVDNVALLSIKAVF